MFHFLGCRRSYIINLLVIPTAAVNNPSSILNSTHLLLSHSIHHKPITKEEEEEPINNNKRNPSSSLTATESYLINSCGLSPKYALSAAQKITFETTEKPDSNLALLKSHGFSDAQITKLTSQFPKLLLRKWDKTIKPKLDYFNSLGYSGTHLTTLVSSNPQLLNSSLERKLKSNYDLLRPIFSTNQQFLTAIHRSSAWLLTIKLETNFFPNVRILQDCGVPVSHIAKLAWMFPRRLMLTTAHLKRSVESLRKMGFDPLSTMFVYGLIVISGMNPSTWARKVAFYKAMGWSEADFISAFRKKPSFVALSEEKIKRVMDFSAEKMNWGPLFIAAHPVILTLSLEKRIIPRCSVVRVLESKGLMERSKKMHFLILGETDFINRYITKYKGQVPELLDAYKHNVMPVGLYG